LSSRPGWTLSRRQRPRARSKANSVISVTRAWGPPRRRGSLGVGTGGADEVDLGHQHPAAVLFAEQDHPGHHGVEEGRAERARPAH
jgi:hypothetical protein